MEQSFAKLTYTLNTGLKIPAVAFGTRRHLTHDTIYEAVKTALQEGYRHIDTAFAYGCEQEVGQAIRDSQIARQEIWITTKLDNHWHHRVDQAVELSLAALGVDYIDLYLMHWPCSLDSDDDSKILANWHFTKTWEHMQKIPEHLVHNIGVANFDIHNLKILLQSETTSVIPAANQIEIHPYWPCNELIEYCRTIGIHCLAYSPLGSRQSLFVDDPVLGDIANTRQKTVQQILLMWGLQRGYSVIPSSKNSQHIRSNLQLDGWELTSDERRRLSAISHRLQVYNDVERMKFPVQIFFDDKMD